MEWHWEEYFGKKVDIVYDDGGTYSGYLFEHSLPEDSDIGEDSISLAPIDKMYELELPSKGIISITVDPNYIEFPSEYEAETEIPKEKFAEELFMLFPEKDKDHILDEYTDNGELLGHPFFGGEVAIPLADLLKEGENSIEVSKYCRLIEKMWKHGDDAVQNIVDVSILELLADEKQVWHNFGLHISQDFKDYINQDTPYIE